jgi:hypothetical protein
MKLGKEKKEKRPKSDVGFDFCYYLLIFLMRHTVNIDRGRQYAGGLRIVPSHALTYVGVELCE